MKSSKWHQGKEHAPTSEFRQASSDVALPFGSPGWAVQAQETLGNARLSQLVLGGDGDGGLASTPNDPDPRTQFQEAVAGASQGVPFQAEMENAFGQDFSSVRSKTGQSTQLSPIGADAAASGEAVAFTATNPSREDVAHELTHVVQARRHGTPSTPSASGVSSPEDASEHEARAVSAEVASGRAAPPIQQSASDIALRESRSERGRARGQSEFDRRTPDSGDEQDGSGEWGVEEPGLTDYANHLFWSRVADSAEIIGLTNAARHMRHYLGNSGSKLEVDVDVMLRDSPSLEIKFEREIAVAKVEAQRKVAHAIDENTSFTLTGDKKNHYFERSESSDWFFAVGGCTYWYTAKVEYLSNGDGTGGFFMMDVTLHVTDNYNWDQGKMVEIAELTVKDEQLGRLHVVGLAQEYPVEGESSGTATDWDWAGEDAEDVEAPSESGSRSSGEVNTADDREDTRIDSGRDSGRSGSGEGGDQ